MSGVVVFDLVEFRDLYPSLSATDDQLNMFFIMAEGFLDNTECSVVKDLATRKIMLYLLVAHLASLNQQVESGNAVVGRVASASEGTVSISFDYGTMGNNERWYLQTPYGSTYWQMTKRYRSMLYRLGKAPMPVNRQYVQ